MPTPSTKVASLAKHETFQRAEKVLKNFKQYKSIEELINKDKEWFRDQANGESLNEVVPGLGSVTVKKPSEGASGVSTIFSEEKFNALDPRTKKKLVELGVVTTKAWTTKPSAAAVVITLNK